MSYESNLKTKLIKESKYITQKINSKTLNLKNYISTENMLSNKLGVTLAKSIPGGNVNNFLKNDILISNIRPYFKKIWYAKFDGGASSDVLIIRSSKDIFSKYLYYVLKDDNFFDYNMKGSKGTKMPRGDKAHIMNYTFLKPKLLEQKAIANILSSLDDKIELNNQMNKTLEELAQTIYKQWFVDFEFPNENGEPYKSSGGKMVNSELGLIPEDWNIVQQGDYFPVVTGKKNANIATENGEYKFFTCSQNVLVTDAFSFDGEAILVAGNGDFNVKYYKGKFEAYQRTYVLIPYNDKLTGLLYFSIKNNLSHITSGHRGSVIKFITKGDLENYKLSFPDEKVLLKYSKTFENILSKIQKNNQENETLAETRDLLLPKLMSGEIRVPIKE